MIFSRRTEIKVSSVNNKSTLGQFFFIDYRLKAHKENEPYDRLEWLWRYE